MRSYLVDSLVELGAAAHKNLQTHGRRNVGHLGKPDRIINRERADGRHHLGAVYQRQPFARFQLDGLQAAFAEYLVAGHFLAFVERFAQAEQDKRQMG